MSFAKSFRDLETYGIVREAAEIIFKASCRFPAEEKYALTDQIRRSSRAVGAMIAEAWGRRRYRNVFVNKLDEAIGEANETQSWLDQALDCRYIEAAEFEDLNARYQAIGGKLNRMIDRADDFCKHAPDRDYRSLNRDE